MTKTNTGEADLSREKSPKTIRYKSNSLLLKLWVKQTQTAENKGGEGCQRDKNILYSQKYSGVNRAKLFSEHSHCSPSPGRRLSPSSTMQVLFIQMQHCTASGIRQSQPLSSVEPRPPHRGSGTPGLSPLSSGILIPRTSLIQPSLSEQHSTPASSQEL